MNTSEKRFNKAQVSAEVGKILRRQVSNMKDKGYSNAAIANALNVKENTVRSLLKKESRD
jgi:orotate phosphoribosyltransferase-like protein